MSNYQLSQRKQVNEPNRQMTPEVSKKRQSTTLHKNRCNPQNMINVICIPTHSTLEVLHIMHYITLRLTNLENNKHQYVDNTGTSQ